MEEEYCNCSRSHSTTKESSLLRDQTVITCPVPAKKPPIFDDEEEDKQSLLGSERKSVASSSSNMSVLL